MTTETGKGNEGWGADFFGTLNEAPPQVLGLLSHVLEAMASEPAFRQARLDMLTRLAEGGGHQVLEAGCGTGVAMPDVLSVWGQGVRYTGVDPTEGFLEAARQRAQRLGLGGARLLSGDIRSLPVEAGSFDAAFCDKVLLHVGPAEAGLRELARAVRSGGRVGAVEWHPYFVVSARTPRLAQALNAIFSRAVYDHMVCANLKRHLWAAGLSPVWAEWYLGGAQGLDERPFWRAFLVEQLPLFVHAGLIEEGDAQALAQELTGLSGQGLFSACFAVQAAVAVKP